jgi:hypothetical protein
MHPYRDTAMRTHPLFRLGPGPAVEELILYGLLVLIGAIPVAIALIQGAVFGVEATLGSLMLGAGALGAIRYVAQARRTTEELAGRHLAGPELAGSRNR